MKSSLVMASPREVGDSDTENLNCDPRERFLLELEFVQCLANPNYVNWLAQNGYLEDKAFISFLEYLEYWKAPEYAKFIIYPHSLYFLDLLKKPEFRTSIANPVYKELVHTQQFYTWLHFRNNRLKELSQGVETTEKGPRV